MKKRNDGKRALKEEIQSTSETKYLQSFVLQAHEKNDHERGGQQNSLLSVTTTASMRNLSEASEQNSVEQRQGFATQKPSLAHDAIDRLSCEKQAASPEGQSPVTSDFSQIQLIMEDDTSSSQEKDKILTIPERSGDFTTADANPAVPDLLSHMCQHSPTDPVAMSPEQITTSTGSASPQLDQLLSELEELKLRFRPETLDPDLSESSGESPGADQPYVEFEDLSPDGQSPCEDSNSFKVSMSSVEGNTEVSTEISVARSVPAHTSISNEAETEVVRVTPDLIKAQSESSVPPAKASSFPGLCSLITTDRLSTSDHAKSQTFGSSPPSDAFLLDKCDESATEPGSSVALLDCSPKEQQMVIPENDVTNVEDLPIINNLDGSQELCDSTRLLNDLRLWSEERTQSTPDQISYSWETISMEKTRTEGLFSQSPMALSSQTPQPITLTRHLNFEELAPYLFAGNISSEDVRPKSDTSHLSTSVETQSTTLQSLTEPRVVIESAFEEEYNLHPEYSETFSTLINDSPKPPTYTDVGHTLLHHTTNCEDSDPETYFDCQHPPLDFSETEPEESQRKSRSICSQPGDSTHPGKQESLIFAVPIPPTVNKYERGVLLSSGSEDYQDVPDVNGPPDDIYEEVQKRQHFWDAHSGDFTFYEPPQELPACGGAEYIDHTKSLAREIAAELGTMSDSSDEELLTTRVVRRRVIIQADDVPDLPAQSVTEEKYTDENGHMVVKRVTRKIIRKCISADGVEKEEASPEGAAQCSVSMAEGDAYSKVTKRTVLKSEGAHTEVTFTEGEGFSASGEVSGECRISRVERTTEVEGERTVTHHGDLSLTSDLPSAQDDFKQALAYVGGFTGVELPQVVERQIVREDGTVVGRARMHKARTQRRTVVSGPGRPKQVLLERVEEPHLASRPHDLQQHLRQLIRRYCDDGKEEDSDDEEEEEKEEEEGGEKRKV